MISRFQKCDCGIRIDRYEILKKGIEDKDGRIRLECPDCKRGTYVSESAAKHIVAEVEKNEKLNGG